MVKGLFTSLEEIAFQNAYVHGQIKKVRDPNTMQNPAKTKHLSTHVVKKNNFRNFIRARSR